MNGIRQYIRGDVKCRYDYIFVDEAQDIKKDWWDYVTILGVKSIVTFGKNWSSIFSDIFTLESKKTGDKEAKTEWLSLLYKLQNKAAKANFSVAKAEYQLLCEAYERFVESDD